MDPVPARLDLEGLLDTVADHGEDGALAAVALHRGADGGQVEAGERLSVELEDPVAGGQTVPEGRAAGKDAG